MYFSLRLAGNQVSCTYCQVSFTLFSGIMASPAEGNQSDLYNLELLKDFPPGPLDEYRKRASFDWKKMRIFLDGEDIIRFKVTKIC